MKPITIVSCGPGGADYVTDAARKAVLSADVLVAAPRLFALFPEANAIRLAVDSNLDDLMERIEAEAQTQSVAVLVSGDAGLFSLSRRVVRQFGRNSVTVLAGVSSIQVAFARLALSWQSAHIISAHATIPDDKAPELCQHDTIAVLGGHAESAAWMKTILPELNKTHDVVCCRNLTLPNEKITPLTQAMLDDSNALRNSVVVFARKGLLS